MQIQGCGTRGRHHVCQQGSISGEHIMAYQVHNCGDDQESKTSYTGLKQIISTYQKGRFKVMDELADNQFECVRGALVDLGACVNNAAADDVPEVEHCIWTIKERVLSINNSLTFKKMPTKLIAEMIYTSVYWLNSLPSESGISSTLIPKALVMGHKPDYPNHCKLEFSTYVQTHEARNNSMAPRTVGDLALHPTSNLQGGYYFYSLDSGKRINWYSWTELPNAS